MTRVGILQDTNVVSVADENAAIMREVNRAVPGAELVWSAEAETALVDAPALDLLVVDYGALVSSYGDGWLRFGRAVERYAEEHPGTLVVLWTSFTVELYAAAFREVFGLSPDAPSHEHEPSADGLCWCGRDEAEHDRALVQHQNVLFRYDHRNGWGPEWADFWKRLTTWVTGAIDDVATTAALAGPSAKAEALAVVADLGEQAERLL